MLHSSIHQRSMWIVQLPLLAIYLYVSLLIGFWTFILWSIYVTVIWNRPNLNVFNTKFGSRSATWVVLLLAVMCLKLPTAWGCTHSPYPAIKFHLSLILYALTVNKGLQTMLLPHQSRTKKYTFFCINLLLTLGAAILGIFSLDLQSTSARNQWANHAVVVLLHLGVLALFELQEYWSLRKKLKLKSPQGIQSEVM